MRLRLLIRPVCPCGLVIAGQRADGLTIGSSGAVDG